jgi:hypothetical protein
MSDLYEVTDQRPDPQGIGALYSGARITVYGTLSVGSIVDGIGVAVQPVDLAAAQPQPLDLVLVYGYAYQGHCYSLPEPVFMVIDAARREAPGAAANARGCGYLAADGYSMWHVDKLDRTVQIQIAGDFFEQLILPKNLPGGAQQPMSYHGKNVIHHRGGKLE